MQEMINFGADFITTDHPEMLQQILKSKLRIIVI